MTKLKHMTEAEIRTLWRNRALSPNRMVGYIADLNSCPKEHAKAYLIEIGLYEEGNPLNNSVMSDLDKKRIIEMHDRGIERKDIVAIVGRSWNLVDKVIRQHIKAKKGEKKHGKNKDNQPDNSCQHVGGTC